MMKLIKRIVLVFGCGLGFCDCYSQNPLVKQWDYRFGGTGQDMLGCFQQTKDGGYILGGETYSGVGGDKTQASWGGGDYWIIKVDSLGIKQWDKNFGGTGVDELYSLEQTSDGGYILGGISLSGISGDKTQPTWGYSDYWIVKTDSLGNKQWDKDFGGTSLEELFSARQTKDGGYILGGFSSSGVGGDKSQPVWGAPGDYDYWIIKTDSMGNKQWDKDLGGMDIDELYSLEQTSDGGYILGGQSSSGISGDKTQASWGDYDYWIVKTDSLGNKQWDKRFGGTEIDMLFSLKQVADGGYILDGYSHSGISGDKTQPTCGGPDYWIVKTDSLGNMQWDKDFGGTDYEINQVNWGNISQTMDGGYLMAGCSYSPISCDKTQNNLGPTQTWVVKTDGLGNKQWDRTLLTDSVTFDFLVGLAIQTKDGCYVMGNYNSAGIGGDKTQPNWDTASVYASPDYWIIKFCDSTLTTSIPNVQSSTFNLQLFPNPTTGTIQLTFTTKHNAPLHCEIRNVMGELVFKSQIVNPKSQINLDVSFLAKGIYLIRVGDGERWENKKLVVE